MERCLYDVYAIQGTMVGRDLNVGGGYRTSKICSYPSTRLHENFIDLPPFYILVTLLLIYYLYIYISIDITLEKRQIKILSKISRGAIYSLSLSLSLSLDIS